MSRSRGLSITELMLAFGLVAVAILGLVGVFASGLKMTARSRDITTATEVGHQVMEQIKFNVLKVGFAYIPAGTYTFNGRPPSPDPAVGATPAIFPPLPYPAVSVNHQDYAIVVTGRDLSPNLKEVRVEVVWGPSGNVMLETHFKQ